MKVKKLIQDLIWKLQLKFLMCPVLRLSTRPTTVQKGCHSKSVRTRSWYAWGLTNIEQWSPCLRIDQNVIAGAKTHLLRAQLNCRVDFGDTTQVAYINVFLVSLRKEATNAINIINEVTGAMDPLSVGTDYVENFNLNGADITLNSVLDTFSRDFDLRQFDDCTMPWTRRSHQPFYRAPSFFISKDMSPVPSM